MKNDKYRAIPQGYMSIGEIAKKMRVTVRTLQYYDKKGLLSPSLESERGRRLYTDKDIFKLHQIQSMKYLGFSLEDIKNRLLLINTTEEISHILLEQTKVIKEKINTLTDVLESLEKFNMEVSQMETVDWIAYADIITLLQSKSDLYWASKHLSGKGKFPHNNINQKHIKDLIIKQNQLLEIADELQESDISPLSKQAQKFAKDFWSVVMELAEYDKSLLPIFTEVATKHGDSKWKSKQQFIEKALDFYLQNTKSNASEEDLT